MNLESRVRILDNSARITIVNGPVLSSRGLYKRRNKGRWKDILMKIGARARARAVRTFCLEKEMGYSIEGYFDG